MPDLLQKLLSLEQTAQVIDKLKGFEGLTWTFVKNLSLNNTEIISLHQLVEQAEIDYLAKKLGISHEEMDPIRIKGEEDRYKELSIYLKFDKRLGIEIVKLEFDYALARIDELYNLRRKVNPSIMSLRLEKSRESYKLTIYNIVAIFLIKEQGEAKIKAAKRYQSRLVNMLK